MVLRPAGGRHLRPPRRPPDLPGRDGPRLLPPAQAPGPLAAGARQALQEELLAGFAQGLFQTPVIATFPLEEVAEAVRRAEQEGGAGKVLLVSPELLGAGRTAGSGA